MNSAELSRRVQPLIPELRENLGFEEFEALMSELSKADSFDSLSEESKQMILEAEASKS